MPESLKKYLQPILKSLHNFGPQLGYNCPFGPKKIFPEISCVNMISLDLLFPIMLQSLKKSFRADPEIYACIILSHNCPFDPKDDFSENLT